MNELQEKLLLMFKWFHNFCSEHKLVYYALGGTALGAVRHKGFIPWDDDMDIGMPRPDYEKMLDIIKKENNFGQYIIEYPLEYKDSMYPICKVYDTSTTLIENVKKQPRRGIFIDIFPLDGIGNAEEESKNNYRKINFWIDLLNAKRCAIRKGRSLFKNASIILSNLLPDAVFGKEILIKKINKMALKYDYKNNNYIVNLFGAWKEKEIVEKKCFGIPKLHKFEDTKIYIPEDADSYLTSLYGDYMELPPTEKRVSHHDYIKLDLEKSYLER